MKVLSMFAALTFVLGLGTQAYATETLPNCQGLQVSGKYVSSGNTKWYEDSIDVRQNGCQVTVVETVTTQDGYPGAKANIIQNTWHFDLSGQTPSVVPQSVVDANHDSQLGVQSLKSLRMKLRLTSQQYGPNVEIAMKMHLPAIERNRFDTDLSVTGLIGFAASSNDGGVHWTSPNYIDFRLRKVRVEAVHSAALAGPLANAFIEGANYILGFLDDGRVLGTVAPQLAGFQRVSN